MNFRTLNDYEAIPIDEALYNISYPYVSRSKIDVDLRETNAEICIHSLFKLFLG